MIASMIFASILFVFLLSITIFARVNCFDASKWRTLEFMIGGLVVMWIISMLLIYFTEATTNTRYEGTYELAEKTTTADGEYAFVLENERGVRTMVEGIGKQMYVQYEEGERLYCSFEGTTHKYNIIPSELNGDDVTYDNLLVYSSAWEEEE